MRPEAREREAVSAAGLLDQGGVAEGLEDTSGIAAHIVCNRQDETGGQLAKRRAGTREGGRIGEELFAAEELIELDRLRVHIAIPCLFHVRNMRGDTPEHLLDGFRGFAVV